MANVIANIPDVFPQSAALRNGALNAIVPMSAHASIPPQFFWPRAFGYIGDRATAFRRIPGFIYDHWVQLAVPNGFPVNQRNPAMLRAGAIILGSVRLGAVVAWGFAAGDIRPAESVDSVIAADGASLLAGAPDATFTALTEGELAAVRILYRVGAAIVGPTAKSLAETGHHFIPPSKGRFDAVLRYERLVASKDATALPDVAAILALYGTQDAWMDLVCHKALHAIETGVMVGLAEDPETPERLKRAGLPVAAVGLPSRGTYGTGLSSAMALIDQVHGFLAMHGGAAATLRTALDTARAHIEAAADPIARRAAQDAAKAILDGAAGNLAYCFGILERAVAERNGSHSLLHSYALKRVAADHPWDRDMGATFYKAHVKDVKARGVVACVRTF